MSMTWDEILISKRLGKKDGYDQITRSEFHRDYDRVVFSSAFRRLQDKTQVFPLAHIDYVRTRLTHSLEVASVGRSLGLEIGAYLSKHKKMTNCTDVDVAGIVATACLAHDIGNPPFGHSGEDAIQEWFTLSQGQQALSGLSEQQRLDFLNFEGNAQGFRILTRLQHPDNVGGLQLTLASLATLMKYPVNSLVSNSYKNELGICAKKFGYFQSEEYMYHEIAKDLSLLKTPKGGYFRHPLSYLVEAADDVCYHFIDLSDGFRLNHLQYNEVEDLLLQFHDSSKSKILNRIKDLHDEKEKVEYLCGCTISKVISEIIQEFIAHEDDLLSGSYPYELVSRIPSNQYMKQLLDLTAQKIYRVREVLEIEAAGFEILGGLLTILHENFTKVLEGNSKRSRKILQLIPNQFLDKNREPYRDKYKMMMSITDYISGMTDSYAVSIYQKLKGISIT
ncbi:MAG: deoxyguanosinetriphosphate triphosphohydrolase [Candidatus Cloacimonetes bacterium]|nr:deoxyguanosinetriphosphate triphosphohydrolase [Candidatus Cloacimonadota bacterium]